jgi:Recombination endonuclease VII
VTGLSCGRLSCHRPAVIACPCFYVGPLPDFSHIQHHVRFGKVRPRHDLLHALAADTAEHAPDLCRPHKVMHDDNHSHYATCRLTSGQESRDTSHMPSPPLVRECPVCGTMFTRRSDTKTCGAACGRVLRERLIEERGRPRRPARSPEETREIRRQRRRVYYEVNREMILGKNRKWASANRAWILEASRAKRLGNMAEHTENERRRRHGVGAPEDFARMWQEQNGCCYLCEKPLVAEEMHMDHDHRCCPKNKSCRRCRRGLACKLCNVLIGDAGDDPVLLRKIADNLEVALARVTERIADLPVQGTLL